MLTSWYFSKREGCDSTLTENISLAFAIEINRLSAIATCRVHLPIMAAKADLEVTSRSKCIQIKVELAKILGTFSMARILGILTLAVQKFLSDKTKSHPLCNCFGPRCNHVVVKLL
jgi:hypothetical protein